MNLQEIIDKEIAAIKKITKPVNVHLVQVSDGCYKGRLPFEIKGEFILNSKNLNDVVVTVSYDNKEVEVEIDSDEHEINAYLSKDEAVLLKAIKKTLKSDSFTEEPAFIVGPPGTGKTKVIKKIIKEALSDNKKLLVVSPTNMAVENVFEDIDTKEIGLEEDDLVLTIKTEDEELRKFSKESIKAKKLQPLEDEIEIIEMAKTEILKTKRDAQPVMESHRALKDASATMLTNLTNERRSLSIKEKKSRQDIDSIERRINSISKNVFIQSIASVFTGDKIDELEADKEKEQKILKKLNNEINSLNEKIELASNEEAIVLKDFKSAMSKIEEANSSLMKITKRLKELKKEIEEIQADNIFETAKVVGSTLIGAILNEKISNAEFDMIIVDEASMALVPLLVSVSQSLREKAKAVTSYEADDSFYEAQNKAIKMALTKRLIFVGDPRQLPPIARTYDMKQSVFDVYGTEEIFQGEDVKNTVFLDINFRNHPHITSAASDLFYGGLLRSGKEDDGANSLYMKRSNSKMVSSQGSFVNHGNMKIVIHQTEQALKRGRRSIGIITPYKRQASLIEENLAHLKEEYPDADIQAGTVHTFQGKEKDIIIYDLTFSPDKNSNYIPATYNGDISSNTAKLLNVAMTRAKSFFIVVGDVNGIMDIEDNQLVLKEWLKRVSGIAKTEK